MRDNVATDNTILVRECLLTLWQRKGIVFTSVAVLVGAGVLYLCVTPKVRRATTRLLVVNEDAAQHNAGRYDPAFIATQAEIAHSRAVVERALEIYMPPGIVDAEDPISSALGSIRVTPVEGTYVLHISYQCSNGSAEKMLEALIKSYRSYLRDSEEDSHSQSLKFLTATEQRLREELERKEGEYQGLVKDGTLIAVGEEAGRVQTAYLGHLGRALTDAKSRRLQLETESASWSDAPEVASDRIRQLNKTVLTALNRLPAAGGNRSFALPKGQQIDHVSEMRTLERELRAAQQYSADLRSRFGEKHPDVRANASQIKQLEQQLEEMLQEIPKVFDKELEVIRQHEAELEELYEKENQRALQLDVHRLENRQYLDTIERLRAAHGSIVEEMHSRRLTSAPGTTGQGTVHVKTITAPRTSPSPVWPIPMTVLVFCGVVGLIGGVCVVLGLDRLAHWTEGELEGSRHLPRAETAPSGVTNEDDGRSSDSTE